MYCECIQFQLNKQKTFGAMRQSEEQFRDYLFISRLNPTQKSRSQHSTVPSLKVSRSTWTRKAMRQKQNESKLNSFHTFFTSNPHRSSARVSHCQKNKRKSMVRESSHQNNASCKTQKSSQTPLTVHFTVSRNRSNLEPHQDLSKSGILLQKMQNLSPPLTKKKSGDRRLFLKTLKIKENANLYKGNFNRFQKKDIIKRIKTKRVHIVHEVEVSPWEQDTTRPLFL